MTTTAAEANSSIPPKFQLWRDRNFISLLSGSGISVLGDGAYFVVLGWFVLNATGSEFALGTTLAVASIPRVMLMIVGGVVADRIDRKLIIVFSLMSRAVILGLFVVLLIVLRTAPALWLIELMAGLFGIIDAFFYPADRSIIPLVVPERVVSHASTLVQTIQQSSTVLGPLLAAGLLWIQGYSAIFAVIAVLFMISAGVFSVMRLRRLTVESDGSVKSGSSFFQDVLEGIKYVLSVRILLLVMIISLGIDVLFLGPVNIGLPVLVKTVGWSGSVYGGYEAGFGAGTVLGGIIVVVLKGFRGKFLWIGGLGGIMGGSMATIGFVHVPWGGILLAGLMGVMNSIVNIPFFAYLQTIVPADKLGRTMSLLTLMSVGLAPVSYTVSSFVLQQHYMSVKFLLFFAGIAISILFLSLYLFQTFRQVEKHPLWIAETASGAEDGMKS